MAIENKEELLKKYEQEIDSFLTIKLMNDEQLVNSIIMSTNALVKWTENARGFAHKYNFNALNETLIETKKVIKHIEGYILDIDIRAKINE